MKKKNNYTESCGNVFADLGLPNPEERLAKAELARQINNLIEKKSLTQEQAALLLEIDQPKVSALSNGKLAGFSLERLFRFLNILGQDVTISIEPKKKSKNAVLRINQTIASIKKKPLGKSHTEHFETIPMQAKKNS